MKSIKNSFFSPKSAAFCNWLLFSFLFCSAESLLKALLLLRSISVFVRGIVGLVSASM